MFPILPVTRMNRSWAVFMGKGLIFNNGKLLGNVLNTASNHTSPGNPSPLLPPPATEEHGDFGGLGSSPDG